MGSQHVKLDVHSHVGRSCALTCLAKPPPLSQMSHDFAALPQHLNPQSCFAMGGAVGSAVAATRCCQACEPGQEDSIEMDTSTEEFAARPWNDDDAIVTTGMSLLGHSGSKSKNMSSCSCIGANELAMLSLFPGLRQGQTLLDMLQGHWRRKEDGQPVGQLSGAL